MKKKLRRVTLLFAVVLLAVVSLKTTENQVQAAITDSEGYTVISTYAELDTLLRSNLSGRFRLGADINVSAKSWNPIGNQSNPFRGELDGNGYTIRGLWCSTGVNNRGIFGWTAGANIHNLNIELDRRGFTGMGGRIGSLVGTASNGTLIEQVHVDGLPGSRINTGVQYVGGLVGVLDGSTVALSSVSNIEVYGSNEVGGLVGIADNGASLNKSFTENVGVKSSGNDAGGFAGKAAHDSRLTCCFSINTDVLASNQGGGLIGLLDYSTVEKSAALGLVRVNSSYVGGLVGEIRGGRVSNSYAQASVTGRSYAGGFAGTAIKSSNMAAEVYNSYCVSTVFASSYMGAFLGRGTIVYSGTNLYDGNVSNVALVNGTGSYITGASPLGKTTADMQKQATYRGWDFNSIWEIEEGQSYAELQCMGWWIPEPVNNVTITYNANGGSGQMQSQTVQQGSDVTLNANQFTRYDYVFLGWSTTAAGEVEYTDQASITAASNMELFAVWGEPIITTDLKSNVPAGQSVYEGSEVEYTFDVYSLVTSRSVNWYDVKLWPIFNGYLKYKTGTVTATLNGAPISNVRFDALYNRLEIPLAVMKPGDHVQIIFTAIVQDPGMQYLEVPMVLDGTGEVVPPTRASIQGNKGAKKISDRCTIKVKKK